MIRFTQLTLLLVATTTLAQADATLTAKGLEAKGRTYVLTAEKDFLSGIRDLDKKKRDLDKILRTRRKMDYQIRRMNGEIASYKAQKEQYEKQQELGGTSSTLAKKIAELKIRIDQASRAIREADAKYEREYKPANRAFVDKAAELHRIGSKVQSRYTELGKDSEVTGALEKAGAKLGPSSGFKAGWKKVTKYYEEVKKGIIDLDMQEDQPFLSVVINNRPPRQMVLSSASNYVVLPHTMAQDLGIRVGPMDQSIELQMADGRTIQGKLTKLLSVRIGQFTVSDVEAVVLEEKASAGGASVGMSWLKHFIFNVDPGEGKLHLTPKDMKKVKIGTR